MWSTFIRKTIENRARDSIRRNTRASFLIHQGIRSTFDHQTCPRTPCKIRHSEAVLDGLYKDALLCHCKCLQLCTKHRTNDGHLVWNSVAGKGGLPSGQRHQISCRHGPFAHSRRTHIRASRQDHRLWAKCSLETHQGGLGVHAGSSPVWRSDCHHIAQRCGREKSAHCGHQPNHHKAARSGSSPCAGSCTHKRACCCQIHTPRKT